MSNKGDTVKDKSVFYSYKDRKFVPKQLDQPSYVHFDLKGNSLHQDSLEARLWEDELKG